MGFGEEHKAAVQSVGGKSKLLITTEVFLRRRAGAGALNATASI